MYNIDISGFKQHHLLKVWILFICLVIHWNEPIVMYSVTETAFVCGINGLLTEINNKILGQFGVVEINQ